MGHLLSANNMLKAVKTAVDKIHIEAIKISLYLQYCCYKKETLAFLFFSSLFQSQIYNDYYDVETYILIKIFFNYLRRMIEQN